MKADIQALVGNPLCSVEKKDYSWFFVFAEQTSIVTESPWRFIVPESIVVTSEDHGQPFGLPQPVDAARGVLSRTGSLLVTAASIHPTTGDLTERLGDLELQFLQMSSGYEAWRLFHQGTEIICTGGGDITYFDTTKGA